MARIDLDLDEMLEGMTRDGMRRFVKKLLAANDAEQRNMLRKAGKNDLADLAEEMHGKPNTPEVEDEPDALDPNEDSEDEEMPPKKGKK